MHETVRAAQVDECAKAADAGNDALARLADLQLFHKARLLRVSPFLHGLALGEDCAIAAAVDFKNLQLKRLAGFFRLPFHAPIFRISVFLGLRPVAEDVARHADQLRHRDESLHLANIDDCAALVEAEDAAFDSLVVFEALLEFTPAGLAQRAVYGQNRGVVRRLRSQHIGDDFVAYA